MKRYFFIITLITTFQSLSSERPLSRQNEVTEPENTKVDVIQQFIALYETKNELKKTMYSLPIKERKQIQLKINELDIRIDILRNAVKNRFHNPIIRFRK